MTIVETGAKAMRSVVWTEDDWDKIGDTSRNLYRNEFRAALRAVRAEDVTDAMLEAFNAFREPEGEIFKGNLARAIAAAIAAGGE